MRNLRSGRSPNSAQAANATNRTCRLPSTVATPAPTSAIAWFHSTRSTARKRPASTAVRRLASGRGPSRRCSSTASGARTGSASAHRKNAVVTGLTSARVTRIADDEMHAAPRIAVNTGRPPLRSEVSRSVPSRLVAVMTVSPYGTDMSTTLVGTSDSSQSHFDADQIEAMAGCVELINTGRGSDGEELRDLADLQAMADKYAFAGVR